MKFSVLIPVYNVERFLPQCLDSVLSQNFDDYEIILINDGSVDNSPSICERYAKRNSRIKYFTNKQNEGALRTRVKAIKAAQGEYVIFLDSDDYWKPQLLETLERELKLNHVDMLLFRFDRVREDGKLICVDHNVFEDHTTFDSFNNELLLEAVVSSRLNTVWSKCINRSILNTNYDNNIDVKTGEDLLHSIEMMKNARSILYLDTSLYCYRQHAARTSGNFKERYIFDYLLVRTALLSELKEINASKTVFGLFYHYLCTGLIRYFKRFADECSDFQHYKMTVLSAIETDIFMESVEKLSFKTLDSIKRMEFFLIKNRKLLCFYLYNRLFCKVKRAIRKMRCRFDGSNSARFV